MASSFSVPLPASRSALLQGAVADVLDARRRGLASAAQASVGLRGLLLVGLVMALAMVLAPEQPVDQAAICERHHGPQACRVW